MLYTLIVQEIRTTIIIADIEIKRKKQEVQNRSKFSMLKIASLAKY